MGYSKEIYSTLKQGGLFDKLTLKKRLEMLSLFHKLFPSESFETVLDIGATADINSKSSNYFESFFEEKEKIIALSDQDASILEQIYPGLKFVKGDARSLPFDDKSIDVVFSSAVIEHVGSRGEQLKMIKEAIRVAKKGVFITTPNKNYPVDFHTFLPFIHLFPYRIKKNVLKLFKLGDFAEEKNLNLLSKKDVKILMDKAGIKNYKIHSIKMLGLRSNLILDINVLY